MASNGKVITIEDVSKLYRIGAKDEVNDNFASAMLDFVRSPAKNFRKYKGLYDFSDVKEINGVPEERDDVLWALRGVTLDVHEGDVIGIIGLNGAGKSTLLKVLARITPPTRGEIKIRGRVGSLLEVGTGFHPELTGRENIYLNGTILGMRKAEVARRFDEIVEFSGMEKFLDTPVKRYSSGMRVRLAFSVAAHLDPEILIIDEVLAVGDAEFQNKCLNKMQDVGQAGRTVLFVSHNMQAVTRLCNRAVLLKKGSVLIDGSPNEIVSAYLNEGHGTTTERMWPDIDSAPGDDIVKLKSVRVKTVDGETSNGTVDVRDPVGIEMTFRVLKPGSELMPYLNVMADSGDIAFPAIDLDPEWRNRPREVGTYTSTAWIPANLLSEGTLSIQAFMRTKERRYRPIAERDVVAFTAVDTMQGDSARGDWVGRMPGVLRPMLKWETDFVPDA